MDEQLERVVELRNLVGEEEPLVDERPSREARDVKRFGVAQRRFAHQTLDALADHVELALEGGGVVGVTATPDEDLADLRHHAPREVAALGRIDGDAAPAEEALLLVADDALEEFEALVALVHLA